MEMPRALLSLAAAAVLVNVAMATDYTVGAPNGGWDTGTDLKAWASSHTFSVGDNLIFKYTSNHDVVEVKEADYGPCRASNPIKRYTGGNTVIGLASPGKRYFICGVAGHCDLGMKVEINTLAATSAPPPATTPEATPPTPPPASPAPASPPPVNPPKSGPKMSHPAPAMSPTSIPASSPTVPSAKPPASSPVPSAKPPASSPVPSAKPPASSPVPSAKPPASSPSPYGSAPPPSFSSAPKANTLVGSALGFCFSMAILLAI